FRVPYWVLFGVIGGVVEIVPYYGPILALLPPLVISLTMGPQVTLAVLGIYVVIHVVDSYILLPYLLDRQVNLPPVAVLVATSAPSSTSPWAAISPRSTGFARGIRRSRRSSWSSSAITSGTSASSRGTSSPRAASRAPRPRSR